MLIFDDQNRTIRLDNIKAPVLTQFFWGLDLDLMDFTLIPLNVIEETVSPSVELCVNSFSFLLPTSWNMLVLDTETSMIDICNIGEMVGRDFNALTHGINESRISSTPLRFTNYLPEAKHVSPSLLKNQVLCLPISESVWINITPNDIYNKYLKNKVLGDLI